MTEVLVESVIYYGLIFKWKEELSSKRFETLGGHLPGKHNFLQNLCPYLFLGIIYYFLYDISIIVGYTKFLNFLFRANYSNPTSTSFIFIASLLHAYGILFMLHS